MWSAITCLKNRRQEIVSLPPSLSDSDYAVTASPWRRWRRTIHHSRVARRLSVRWRSLPLALCLHDTCKWCRLRRSKQTSVDSVNTHSMKIGLSVTQEWQETPLDLYHTQKDTLYLALCSISQWKTREMHLKVDFFCFIQTGKLRGLNL